MVKLAEPWSNAPEAMVKAPVGRKAMANERIPGITYEISLGESL